MAWARARVVFKGGASYLTVGWGAGIRTPIGRSRVGSPTVERHPNVIGERYDTLTLAHCQAMFWAGIVSLAKG